MCKYDNGTWKGRGTRYKIYTISHLESFFSDYWNNIEVKVYEDLEGNLSRIELIGSHHDNNDYVTIKPFHIEKCTNKQLRYYIHTNFGAEMFNDLSFSKLYKAKKDDLVIFIDDVGIADYHNIEMLVS